MKMFNCTLLLGVMFGVIVNVSAETRYVARGGQEPVSPYTSWGTAASNIHEAVNAASAGDTVLISNGVYTLTAYVYINKGITLRSFNNGAIDRDGTIVNGNYPNTTNRCFYLNHAHALVQGFTITNGFMVDDYGGGGVRIEAGTLRDCLVTGNVCTNASNSRGGGGVYANGGSSLITHCDIIANLATWDDTAGHGSNKGGGGVRLNFGAQMWNSRVMYNACPIYWTAGGGVYLYGGEVHNSLIVSNTALDGYAGGGVWVGNSEDNLLRNCLIMGNDKGRTGYGAGVGAAAGHAQIENCTIVANDGPGLGRRVTANYVLVNTICYSNALKIYSVNRDQGAIVATNCLVDSESMSLIDSGEGNLTDNPMFVDFSAGNYRLTGRSPGVNRGINLPWMDDAHDLDGHARILEAIVDVGAFEWKSPGTILTIR